MIKRFGFLRTIGLAIGIAALGGQAYALNTAYTSFGPHQSFLHGFSPQYIGSGAGHPGFLPAGNIWLAASFTATATGPLDHVDVALGNFSGLPWAIVTLVNDNGSGLPNVLGPQLETFTTTKVPAVSGTYKATKLKSVAHPTVTAGTTYWLIVAPIGLNTNAQFASSTTVSQSVIYSNDGGLTWNGYTGSQSAFDVVVLPSI